MDKLFVVFVLLIVGLTYGTERTEEETDKLIEKIQGACAAESKVPPDTLAKARKLDYDPNDRALQCYTKCMLTKWLLFNDKGEVNLETFANNLTGKRKPGLLDAAEKCQNEDDEDLCKKGMKIYQCFQKVSGEEFVFF